ncbi:Uu.00g047870.m01.CDS01 [Anthostomella pinea]|uniref:Protein HGH1 homolog n=1 Tax=Anthostomella pinea TaxID=933095 RepID=A0AAI8VBL9_9PEZI|nr:Uu.00g047870.m01.CDS01 [Anthostomella pinea]
MRTELEELVGLVADPKPEVRGIAAEHLVPYSISQPGIFKVDKLGPVKNLKLLVRDHPKIAEHIVTILINLSADREVLESLATDDKFLSEVFRQVVNPSEPNANLLSMLLANLAKWDSLKRVLELKQSPPEELKSNDMIMNQLLDLFVKGADGTYNKNADFDHLAYLFADLTKHAEVRHHFVRKQDYDGVIPLTKLKVFTEHKSDVRRKGVASTIKNVAFDVPSHPLFMSEDDIDILPYILLPIMGNEEYDEEDSMAMLPDLQLLAPDKQRDTDPAIIQTHVETLLLLTSSREARERMREVKVYPLIRETHLRVQNEGIQEACERLVQVLMREEEQPNPEAPVKELTNGDGEEDDDEDVVEV